MTHEDLLALKAEKVFWLLTARDMMYLAKTLNAFWTYDYEAATQGRVGMHALLKSGRHSDGFFESKILLAPENIRSIIAHQIVWQLQALDIPAPNYVAGVPNGATLLGESIAEMLRVPVARLEKVDGQIILAAEIPKGATLLLVEDFCTRGTGFTEAVTEVKRRQPPARFMPYAPVIVNRGSLKEISVEGVGSFEILPVVEWRIEDWDPTDCPLCVRGSEVIKPKVSAENWQMLTTSQV